MWRGVLVLLACLGAIAVAAEPIELDIGSMKPKPRLGFGWGQAEASDGVNYRWITHLEADARIDIETPGDAELTVRARPLYLPYTRQTVSVYVNRRHVGDWVCPDHPEFEDYRMAVPARYWRVGENQLTFRLAYRKQVGPDSRELALCIDTIGIRMD